MTNKKGSSVTTKKIRGNNLQSRILAYFGAHEPGTACHDGTLARELGASLPGTQNALSKLVRDGVLLRPEPRFYRVPANVKLAPQPEKPSAQPKVGPPLAVALDGLASIATALGVGSEHVTTMLVSDCLAQIAELRRKEADYAGVCADRDVAIQDYEDTAAALKEEHAAHEKTQKKLHRAINAGSAYLLALQAIEAQFEAIKHVHNHIVMAEQEAEK
jgi:hypothetical protein